ncbi:DeoR family transcriptional regulator [Candidatus Lokiarchaeum ossiferum]|uniref:DeoR family transcriptional regulator n=1 Tax=Candidatus Lokiarchaeum ossiferum TaxID=2951803 RepID=UPI00352EF8B9
MSSKKNLNDATHIFFQAFQNDININILAILQMYHSMNITQISNLSGYSKTTIRRHLQELDELGVLTSEERPVNIQGRYTPIYYSIASKSFSGENESFNYQTASISSIKQMINVNKVAIRNFTKYLEMFFPLFDHLDTIDSVSELKSNILTHLPNSNPDCRMLFFNEKEMEELCKIRMEFMEKINQLLEKQQQHSSTTGREFLYFDGYMNLKDLFEFKAEQVKLKKKKKPENLNFS